jgi:hypothetical protein
MVQDVTKQTPPVSSTTMRRQNVEPTETSRAIFLSIDAADADEVARDEHTKKRLPRLREPIRSAHPLIAKSNEETESFPLALGDNWFNLSHVQCRKARNHIPLSYNGQLITLVLAALHQMQGVRTKQEMIAYIDKHGWFHLNPGDEVVYPSHEYTNKEPRWHTWIAFGRQAAAEKDLLSHFGGRDQWKISPKGTEKLDGVRAKLASGVYDIRRGYFWCPVFKSWLCPGYTQSDKDAKRPPALYDPYE